MKTPTYARFLLAAVSLFLVGCADDTTLVNPSGKLDASQNKPSGDAVSKVDQHYRIMELGSVGDMVPVPRGMNNNGQVVGWMRAPGQVETHAFIWENGVMRDLGLFGGWSSMATAINDHGQVLIDVSTSSMTGYSIIWNDGQITRLAELSSDGWTITMSINNRSQVSGDATYTGIHTCPVLWQGGSIIKLAPFDVYDGGARSINDRGQAVGYLMNMDSRLSAFIWEKGSMHQIEGGMEDAFCINNRGQVVGRGVGYAFLWDKGQSTNLGRGEAYAINSRGQVVLTSEIEGARRVFVWENGTRTLLPTLGGILDLASGINERGEVLGATNNKAVLWRPVH